MPNATGPTVATIRATGTSRTAAATAATYSLPAVTSARAAIESQVAAEQSRAARAACAFLNAGASLAAYLRRIRVGQWLQHHRHSGNVRGAAAAAAAAGNVPSLCPSTTTTAAAGNPFDRHRSVLLLSGDRIGARDD